MGEIGASFPKLGKKCLKLWLKSSRVRERFWKPFWCFGRRKDRLRKGGAEVQRSGALCLPVSNFYSSPRIRARNWPFVPQIWKRVFAVAVALFRAITRNHLRKGRADSIRSIVRPTGFSSTRTVFHVSFALHRIFAPKPKFPLRVRDG